MKASTKHEIERMIEGKLGQYRGTPANISFSKYSHGTHIEDITVDLVWLIREILNYLGLEVDINPQQIVLTPKKK